MAFKLVYLVSCPELAGAARRSDTGKDVEILLLRHDMAVLRRTNPRVTSVPGVRQPPLILALPLASFEHEPARPTVWRPTVSGYRPVLRGSRPVTYSRRSAHPDGADHD